MGKMEEGKAILDEGKVAEVTKSLAKASVELVRRAGGACASTTAGILAETSQLKPKVIAELTDRKPSTIRNDRGRVRKGHFGVFGNMTKERREFYLYRMKFYAVVDGKILPVDSHERRKKLWDEGLGNLAKENEHKQGLTQSITFMDNSMVSCNQFIPGLEGNKLPRKLAVNNNFIVEVIRVAVQRQLPRKNIPYEEEVLVVVLVVLAVCLCVCVSVLVLTLVAHPRSCF